METITEYFSWLEEIKKSSNQSTQTSIDNLIVLLGVLNERNILLDNPPRIIERLQLLDQKIKSDPLNSKLYIDSCCNSVKTISAKFYGVVPKGHYQNECISYGISLGILVGSIIFVITDDVAYLGLGLAIGASIGLGIGASLDSKAKQENRVLSLD